MDLAFPGAAREVAGSCYLLRTGGHRLLVDCGLFQGGRDEAERNAAEFPFDPAAIDAVILTRAHLDHAGRLPLLLKRGFAGPIYTRPASCELCAILLEDSAGILGSEAEWSSRKRERKAQDTMTDRGLRVLALAWCELGPTDDNRARLEERLVFTGLAGLEDPQRSLASTGLLGNRLILGGVALELALLALFVYTGFGNTAPGTAPLEAGARLIVLPFALGMAVLEEARKWLARRAARRREET